MSKDPEDNAKLQERWQKLDQAFERRVREGDTEEERKMKRRRVEAGNNSGSEADRGKEQEEEETEEQQNEKRGSEVHGGDEAPRKRTRRRMKMNQEYLCSMNIQVSFQISGTPQRTSGRKEQPKCGSTT